MRLGQRLRLPTRQNRHEPQAMIGHSDTRSPAFQSPTPLPTSAITPEISCPGTTPCLAYFSPLNTRTSEKQRPVAAVRRRISPGPAWGVGTSSTTTSPGPLKTQALTGLGLLRAAPGRRLGVVLLRGRAASRGGLFLGLGLGRSAGCGGHIRGGREVEALEQAGLAACGSVLVDDSLLRGLVQRTHRGSHRLFGGRRVV